MIKIKNLKKIYKLGEVEVVALDNVNLEIKQGEVVCIMGRSGSGKSTLMRQLGMLDRPTGGEVFIEKEEVTKLSDRQRAKRRLSFLGYVFQEFALLPELTAHENVYLPGMMLSAKGEDYKLRAKTLLEKVGLGKRIHHAPRELSGGEQQRVAIARSLINKPKYVFADEPVANLDSISARVVMETLVKLNNDLGVTVVFVSHDPNDKQYASRTIYLRDGKLVEPYL